MTIEDLATIQPGLARIMPEVGARTWKLFYAAKEANWPMAKFQYKEIIRSHGARRVHASRSTRAASTSTWPRTGRRSRSRSTNKDFEGVRAGLPRSRIDVANAYHELKQKPYIRWKLPDTASRHGPRPRSGKG